MRKIQRLGVIAAVPLLLANGGWANPEVIGVVTDAAHASLGTYSASAGSSVFDGDKLSTGSGGRLQLRGSKAIFHLEGESSALLRVKTGSAEKFLELELLAGEVTVSSAAGAANELFVCNSRIRPMENAPSVVQVRLLGPKTLSIFVRRGTAEFSYRGEVAVIGEGRSYRVELDPPDDGSGGDEKNKKPTRKRRMFVLIAIGVMAAGTIYPLVRAFESPDRP